MSTVKTIKIATKLTRCHYCKKSFFAKNKNRRYCSGRHRTAAWRIRRRNATFADFLFSSVTISRRARRWLSIAQVLDSEVPGMRACSIPELAEILGVSRTTLYVDFRVRPDLFAPLKRNKAEFDLLKARLEARSKLLERLTSWMIRRGPW